MRLASQGLNRMFHAVMDMHERVTLTKHCRARWIHHAGVQAGLCNTQDTGENTQEHAARHSAQGAGDGQEARQEEAGDLYLQVDIESS